MPGQYFNRLDPETGERVERVWVDSSEYNQAIESGLQPTSDIAVRNPVTGTVQRVGAESITAFSDVRGPNLGEITALEQEAIVRRALMEDAYSGFGNKLKAFGAGALRTGTLGLSDVIIKDLGGGDDLNALREFQPGASLLGEIAGGFTPGTGLLGKLTPAGRVAALGTKVSTKVGGGLRGAVAGAAVEGAAFGAGLGFSNVVLSDTPLISEAAVSEIGLNALLGGGIGGAVGGAAHGILKTGAGLVSRAERRQLVQDTAEIVDNINYSGMVQPIKKQLKPGKTVSEEISFQLSKEFTPEIEAIQKLIKKNDLDIPNNLAGKLNELDEAAALGSPKEYMAAHSDLVKEVKRVSETLGITPAKFSDPSGAIVATKLSGAAGRRVKQALDDFENLTGGDFRKLFDLEPADFLKATKSLDDYSKAAQASGAPDITEELMNHFPGTSVGRAEIADSFALMGVKELPSITTDLTNLQAAYIQFRAAGGRAIEKAPKKKAGFLATVGKASARRSGEALTGAGIRPGGSPGAIVGSQVKRTAVGMLFDKAFSVMTGNISTLIDASGRAVTRVNHALGQTVAGAGKIASRGRRGSTEAILRGFDITGKSSGPKETPKEAYDRIYNDLARIQAAPEAAYQMFAENLEAVTQTAPGVGAALTNKAMEISQFLWERAPKDHGLLQKFGRSSWRPQQADLDKFARYIEAVKDPAGIVERFSAGKATMEDSEVLRTLYPRMFTEVRSWFQDNLEEVQKKYTYEQRLQTGRLLGTVLDPIAAQAASWQGSFLTAPLQPPAPLQKTTQTNQPTMAQSLEGNSR